MNRKVEKLIGPTKELREYMESLKRRPPLSYEKMKEQFRRGKEQRASKQFQDEERFVRANRKRLAEAWNRLPGRKDENNSKTG